VRVAFISFEYPPSLAIGGIGTYVWEASQMLSVAGVSVEVFSAGLTDEESVNNIGVRVHRVACSSRDLFRESVLSVFSNRHLAEPFDLIESPEFSAEGLELSKTHPDLAVVVKLHTPRYLLSVLGYVKPSLLDHIRFTLGALRRWRLARLQKPIYDPEQDIECHFCRSADEIAAPSQAIADRLGQDWNLDPARISVYAYPFKPDPSLLALPIATELKTIGFVGRLEARKGVVELVKALPRIMSVAPHLSMYFIGPSWPYRGTDMQTWILRHYHSLSDRISFSGPVPRENLADELSKCDVVVLPSRWESFGLVCPEAMASGRLVIGSAAGGMAEIIEHGRSGLLVQPHSPQAISAAVLSLVSQPERVSALASAGRQRVLDLLAPEHILPQQLASYDRAIARARLRR
jgi:glycogen synthase